MEKKSISEVKVRESSSSCLYNRRISKDEIIKRLFLADDIFYQDGEIIAVQVKVKIKGKKLTYHYLA